MERGYVEASDRDLLAKVASTHASLVLSDQSSEPILTASAAAADRQDFVTRLLALGGR